MREATILRPYSYRTQLVYPRLFKEGYTERRNHILNNGYYASPRYQTWTTWNRTNKPTKTKLEYTHSEHGKKRVALAE